MHNTLVHALEGPGPKAGTQKECWGSGPGTWPAPDHDNDLDHDLDHDYDLDHDLDSDKQHPCVRPVGRTSGGFFSRKKVSKKIGMRMYKKRVYSFVPQTSFSYRGSYLL